MSNLKLQAQSQQQLQSAFFIFGVIFLLMGILSAWRGGAHSLIYSGIIMVAAIFLMVGSRFLAQQYLYFTQKPSYLIQYANGEKFAIILIALVFAGVGVVSILSTTSLLKR